MFRRAKLMFADVDADLLRRGAAEVGLRAQLGLTDEQRWSPLRPRPAAGHPLVPARLTVSRSAGLVAHPPASRARWSRLRVWRWSARPTIVG